ncbi:nuclear transport factor 2 family protein [Nocardia puris]|uniref:Uncharacterized protein n=1 Tax=Nocardia puris TaxID=208602 RepID=A0A366E2J3_9NOCA|nr:nuclear transport factor 2 family protein [Nocardia puris]MBF6212593.1 nuclear transport factor 2 family protein [Nocardia puris]MBF6369173.1 nuclear transport factor 2 family protein [Nocardia puris]MBF6461182.1 nuclear transport factor 2 family protein [Nocardia puris]RBO96590.1 hypothetical protein DFR74_101605 [Nocardia puris]
MTSEAHADLIAAVRNLHDDLAAWLGSAAAPEVFERFAAAQHVDFTIVTVSGEIAHRTALLEGLGGARNTAPGLTIDVSDITVVARAGDQAVVRFLESHRRDGHTSARRVTAVLLAQGDSFRWLTVHETALPDR